MVAVGGEAKSKRINFHWDRRFLANVADKADVMGNESMLMFARSLLFLLERDMSWLSLWSKEDERTGSRAIQVDHR